MGNAVADRDLFALSLHAKAIAKEAGKLIFSLRFPAQSEQKDSNQLCIDEKSNSTDLVTTADIASQRLVFDRLRQHCPNDRFIGEEDGKPEPLDNRATWIVDAIDGTTNFVHGLHDFAVCIALAVDKAVAIGVVYNPATDEMFSAVRGYGAFLNDIPISVSSCSLLRDSLVLTEWGYERSELGIDLMLKANRRMLMHGVRGVRQLGSGALDMCYVAMGRAECVVGGIATGDSWSIWDYAAASIVAEEAGAVLRTKEGHSFHIEEDSVICSAPGVIDEMVSVLNPEK